MDSANSTNVSEGSIIRPFEDFEFECDGFYTEATGTMRLDFEWGELSGLEVLDFDGDGTDYSLMEALSEALFDYYKNSATIR